MYVCTYACILCLPAYLPACMYVCMCNICMHLRAWHHGSPVDEHVLTVIYAAASVQTEKLREARGLVGFYRCIQFVHMRADRRQGVMHTIKIDFEAQPELKRVRWDRCVRVSRVSVCMCACVCVCVFVLACPCVRMCQSSHLCLFVCRLRLCLLLSVPSASSLDHWFAHEPCAALSMH